MCLTGRVKGGEGGQRFGMSKRWIASPLQISWICIEVIPENISIVTCASLKQLVYRVYEGVSGC